MAERIFWIIILLLALVLLFFAIGYTSPISYDPIGPRPFPILLLIFLAIISVLAGFFAFKDKAQPLDVNLRVILLVIVLLVYGLLFESLGYIPATFLSVLVISNLFGGTLKKNLIVALVIALVSYWFFAFPLDISLPMGVLRGFWR